MPKLPDRIPALNPAEPGIYRRILETADRIREQRLEQMSRYEARQLLSKLGFEGAEATKRLAVRVK